MIAGWWKFEPMDYAALITDVLMQTSLLVTLAISIRGSRFEELASPQLVPCAANRRLCRSDGANYGTAIALADRWPGNQHKHIEPAGLRFCVRSGDSLSTGQGSI